MNCQQSYRFIVEGSFIVHQGWHSLGSCDSPNRDQWGPPFNSLQGLPLLVPTEHTSNKRYVDLNAKHIVFRICGVDMIFRSQNGHLFAWKFHDSQVQRPTQNDHYALPSQRRNALFPTEQMSFAFGGPFSLAYRYLQYVWPFFAGEILTIVQV